MLKQFDDFDLDIQKMLVSYGTVEVEHTSAIETVEVGHTSTGSCSYIVKCGNTTIYSREKACR